MCKTKLHKLVRMILQSFLTKVKDLIEYRIVKLGEYDSSTTLDGPTVSFRVKQVLKHPYYETRTYSNDIALLKLHRKTNYNGMYNSDKTSII